MSAVGIRRSAEAHKTEGDAVICVSEASKQVKQVKQANLLVRTNNHFNRSVCTCSSSALVYIHTLAVGRCTENKRLHKPYVFTDTSSREIGNCKGKLCRVYSRDSTN